MKMRQKVPTDVGHYPLKELGGREGQMQGFTALQTCVYRVLTQGVFQHRFTGAEP